MNRIFISILALATSALAVDLKANAELPSTAGISDIVEAFATYFDEPMSQCEVKPIAIESKVQTAVQGLITVTVKMDCDMTNSQEHFINLAKTYLGKPDRRTGEYTGIIGKWDGMIEFHKKMKARYPWLDLKWDAKFGDFYFLPNSNYNAAPTNRNPVWFKIYLDGKLLRDSVMAEARKQGDNSIDSIVRIDANFRIAEVQLDPPEGEPDPNYQFGFKESHEFRISFKVSPELARAVKGNSNVDVQVERVYKFNTLGYFNRQYYFPAVDRF
jgi:hypothetical protein